MEELEKIKAWLMTCPGWEGALPVDHTAAVPGHFGLYPKGVQQLSRQEDVLGNCRVRYRSKYVLYCVTTAQQDNTAAAGWLMTLQSWINDQAMAGKAPTFGDVPDQEQLRAEQGMLHKVDQPGTGTYAVTITAEYTKVYPAQ